MARILEFPKRQSPETKMVDFIAALDAKIDYLTRLQDIIGDVVTKLKTTSEYEVKVISIVDLRSGDKTNTWKQELDFLLHGFNLQVTELDKLRNGSADIFPNGIPSEITKKLTIIAGCAYLLMTFHTESKDSPQVVAEKLEILKQQLTDRIKSQ